MYLLFWTGLALQWLDEQSCGHGNIPAEGRKCQQRTNAAVAARLLYVLLLFRGAPETGTCISGCVSVTVNWLSTANESSTVCRSFFVTVFDSWVSPPLTHSGFFGNAAEVLGTKKKNCIPKTRLWYPAYNLRLYLFAVKEGDRFVTSAATMRPLWWTVPPSWLHQNLLGQTWHIFPGLAVSITCFSIIFRF